VKVLAVVLPAGEYIASTTQKEDDELRDRQKERERERGNKKRRQEKSEVKGRPKKRG
jgi:hypothetical protein